VTAPAGVHNLSGTQVLIGRNPGDSAGADIDLISDIALHEEGGKARDLLGRVYEYLLAGFAGSEGKRGGEFYTPGSVVRVLVKCLSRFLTLHEKLKGGSTIPCCGSGGMFVQAERFVQAHGGRLADIGSRSFDRA